MQRGGKKGSATKVQVKEHIEKSGLALKNLETVERYNTLTQLKRILSGEYDKNKIIIKTM